MNKIDLMHGIFGRNESHCCAECSHFARKSYHDKAYRKCLVYGDTCSQGTDWKASYVACGLAPDGSYSGRRIVELANAQRRPKEIDAQGQMSLF